MSLIKATFNAARGTLADQYKEFIMCNEMSSNVLVRKGQVLDSKDNTNKGRDNVLTDGTGIVVNEGQCMIVVENGQIVEFCNEPGKFIYNNDLNPSMLTGGWDGLKKSFGTLKERIQTGGQKFDDQRVYYINTKEIMGNKFGIGQVPFRDSEFNFTIKISAYGEYSYKITDPLMFYTNVTGHVDKDFTRDKIDSQFKSEIQASLQPALGKIALQKIAYDQLPLFTKEIGKALNEELTEEWVNRRGLSIESFAIASVTPDEESAKKIEEFQHSRVYTDATMLGARIGTAQSEAMIKAAENKGGALTGFMGMGMAQQAGNFNPSELMAMGQQQKMQQSIQQQDVDNNSWTCECGAVNNGKFCNECGNKRSEQTIKNGWTCECGTINTGKFCSECGNPKKEDNVCNKCGFKSENIFKFCPECGQEKN